MSFFFYKLFLWHNNNSDTPCQKKGIKISIINLQASIKLGDFDNFFTLYHFHCSQPLLHKRARFMCFRKWCDPDLWKDRAKRWLQYPTIHPRTMLGSVQELPWCNWMWSWGNYSQYWNWRPWRVESKMLCSHKQRNIWKWREWKILLGVFQLWYR